MSKKITNLTQSGYLGLFVGLVVSFPCVVNSAQWYSESSTRFRSVYDDNLRLTSGDHDAVVGMILAGTIKAGKRTETSNINVKGGTTLKKYSGEDNLDTNDFDLGIDATHRTKRDEFTLTTAVKLDSTLSSEIQSSGLMQRRKRRIKKDFALSWARSLSERTSLKLSYSYLDTDYKNIKNTGLSNYTYQSIESMLSYSLDKKTNISLTLRSSLYKGSNRTKTEMQDYGVSARINHNFSETFSVGAGAGLRYSDTEYRAIQIDNHNTDTGFLLNVNVKHTFEQMTVNGLLSRSVMPSGAGALLVTDKLSAEIDYRVDERLNLNIESAVYRNSSADEDDESRDRVFFSIQPKVRWKLTRRWLIEGSYRYRRQRYDSTGLTADSNAVFLSAKYVWPSKPSAGLW